MIALDQQPETTMIDLQVPVEGVALGIINQAALQCYTSIATGASYDRRR